MYTTTRVKCISVNHQGIKYSKDDKNTFANAHIATKNAAVIKKLIVQVTWPEDVDQEINLINVWGLGFCLRITKSVVKEEGLPDVRMIVMMRLTESHMRQWYCRTYLQGWRWW
jgi:hypothetical protein